MSETDRAELLAKLREICTSPTHPSPSLKQTGDYCLDQAEALALLDAEFAKVRAEEREACAHLAESERLTGIPPIGQWSTREIEIAEATGRAFASSIATAIRSRIPS